MIEQFHFLRPWWLMLLIPLIAILWLLIKGRIESGSWRRVIDERLLPFVLTGADENRRSWTRWILSTAALLTIVALAGPTWKQIPQPVYHKESALVVALDLSRSMDAADIKPSRLARARHKIADILNLRKEGQTALVVYAADAFTVTPLTTDVDTIQALLPSLESRLMPAQGTRADRALALAFELFANSGIARGDVLLVSDGFSELEVSRIESLLDEKPGQRVSVLAIGTREGGPVPLKDGGFLKDRSGAIVIADMKVDNLRYIARRGGGVFATISTGDLDINTLTYLMDASIDEREARLGDSATDLWRELGPGLLLLVLPLAALAFRRGLIWMLPLLVVVVPPDVHALDWQALWQNDDKRASQLFEQGRHAEAAELFDNRDWKASSQYKAEDYASALETWQQGESEDAQYNHANALAKLGRYQQALEAYDALLERNPGHQDARHNRDVIAAWMQQQEREQQDDGEQQQQGDDEQQPGEGQQQAGDGEQQAGEGEQQQAGEGEQQQAGEGEQQQAGEGEQQQSAQNESQQQDARQPQQADSGQQSESQQQGEQQQPGEAPGSEALANLEQQMSEQAAEQWLRKIPDDPGGLLRRKFLYQYRKRGGVDTEAKSW